MAKQLRFLMILLFTEILTAGGADTLFLKAHINFLASAELNGRRVASPDERVAVTYIESELIKYGVEKYPGMLSYRQTFPLTVKTVKKNSGLTFYTAGNQYRLEIGKSFFSDPYALRDNSDSVSLYFAGSGEDDTVRHFYPYRLTNLSGSYVILLSPPQTAESGVTVNRVVAALQNGAKGIILVLGDDAEAQMKELNDEAVRKQYLLSEGQMPEMPPIYIITSDAFRKVLRAMNGNTKYPVQQTDFTTMPPMMLPFQGAFSVSVDVAKEFGTNVIGVLPGSDSLKRNEYIAVSAHLDHLGRNDTTVYFGADDDASGVATILETARLLSSEERKRSLLFIFHSGEEAGLLGSKFLTANFTGMTGIKTLINIDMIGRGHTDTLYSVGSARKTTELKKIVEDVNKKSSGFVFNYRFDADDDPERLYFRSDHYNYALQGIPVVFFYDYMKEDYHQPGDTPDKINYFKMKKGVQLITSLMKTLSVTGAPYLEFPNESK